MKRTFADLLNSDDAQLIVLASNQQLEPKQMVQVEGFRRFVVQHEITREQFDAGMERNRRCREAAGGQQEKHQQYGIAPHVGSTAKLTGAHAPDHAIQRHYYWAVEL